jgi:protein-tyrosine phosphatase
VGAVGDRTGEVACRGGTGRTGTALACPVAHDGVPAAEAVACVRRTHRPRAVETWPGTRLVAAFVP